MSASGKTSRRIRNLVFALFTFSAFLAPVLLTSQFGYGFSPILTGSMQPSANPGDIFVTRLVRASDLNLNEIIVVNNQSTGIYYSHRIIEIRDFNGELRITTKGDANTSADRDPFIASPYTKVSKALRIVPYVGRPMVYMNTAQGRQAATSFLVVANVMSLFVILFRRKIITTLNPERVYKELYAEERRNRVKYQEQVEKSQESYATVNPTDEKAGSNR